VAGATISLTLKAWRQDGPEAEGRFETYEAKEISTSISVLEMLDLVNMRLEKEGKEPVAFESNCREGICGSCGAAVNGQPHGPQRATTLCQLYMRHFTDGDTLIIEPFRASAFPVIKDLVVDRSALDRIIQAGGYVTVKTGQACDANAILIPKAVSDRAFRSAACIGCGACAAACPNASASLFAAAKVAQLAQLPQGDVGRTRRVREIVQQMDEDRFGSCSKHYECQAVCPKEIGVENIAIMNREYLRAMLLDRR